MPGLSGGSFFAMPDPTPSEPPPELDLSPYEGCWVAIVRGQVCGAGRTADAARRAASRTRPREIPVVIYVRAAPPTP